MYNMKTLTIKNMKTRGEYCALAIKAHPEMTEQQIAEMIDNNISAAEDDVSELYGDSITSVCAAWALEWDRVHSKGLGEVSYHIVATAVRAVGQHILDRKYPDNI